MLGGIIVNRYCKYHPGTQALWYCSHDGLHLCQQCVDGRNDSLIEARCLLCNQELESSEQGQGGPLWRQLDRYLRYPFTPVLLPVLLVWALLAALVPPPEWQRLAGFYTLASVVTFLFYGLDKRAATRGGWRTSEARLHLFELLGGWPGALLAQRVFRHKTRKAEFQVVFYLAVAANLGALGWLLCADAGEDLRSTVGLTQVTLGWLQGFAS